MHNQDWTALMNTICVVGRDEFRPDVGIWIHRPTFGQQAEPIVNKCPPPDVWIEASHVWEGASIDIEEILNSMSSCAVSIIAGFL